MKPELITSKSLERSGMQLVAFRQCALPVFYLKTRFLTLVRKELRAIPRFVLESIDAGLSTAEEISQFLGVDEVIITDALTELIKYAAIYVGATGDGQSHKLLLTSIGKDVLVRLNVSAPEEQVASVAIDGLTRTYVAISREELIRMSQVEPLGLLELPATPNTKPEPEEIDTELKRFYSSQVQVGRKAIRDVLEVVAIDRTERMFRDDAYLLYYVQDKTLEPSLWVGDKLSSSHSDKLRGMVPQQLSPFIPNQIAEALPRLNPLIVLLGEEGNPDSILQGLSVVGVFDLVRWLNKAVKRCEKRLLISCGLLRSTVVTTEFIGLLESALNRGVDIRIIYDRAVIGESDNAAICHHRLESLDVSFPNMHISHVKRENGNALIYDDQMAIVTAFEWLAYLSNARIPHLDERGYHWSGSAGIDRLYVAHTSSQT